MLHSNEPEGLSSTVLAHAVMATKTAIDALEADPEADPRGDTRQAYRVTLKALEDELERVTKRELMEEV